MKDKSLKKLIQKDYANCLARYCLPMDENVKEALIPQTILGHAIEGHATFFPNHYPNITIDEIFESLGFNPLEKRKFREDLIYEVKNCLEDLISGKIDKLVNSHGNPILGATFLKDQKLSLSKETFKGAALAGRMDSDVWRNQTLCDYPLTLKGNILEIGFGKEYVIDTNKLNDFKLTIEDLAEKDHSKMIDSYRAGGLIVEKSGYSKGLENVFIRTNSGLGCCDDACLIAIGRLHSPDALLLAWAIDAVDTYSKCTINSVEGGFDEWLGKELEKKWSEKYNEELVTKEETTEIIYLGAKRNDPAITFSSSHRRFNEMGLNQLYSTILNHYNFAKDGTRPPKYSLGFDQTSSKHFYKTMEERFELFGKGKLKKS